MDKAIHNHYINQTGWMSEDLSEKHLHDSDIFKTEMSRTIKSLLQNNRSLQKIAKSLLFHKHFYCIGCITKLYLKNTSKGTDS